MVRNELNEESSSEEGYFSDFLMTKVDFLNTLKKPIMNAPSSLLLKLDWQVRRHNNLNKRLQTNSDLPF